MVCSIGKLPNEQDKDHRFNPMNCDVLEMSKIPKEKASTSSMME